MRRNEIVVVYLRAPIKFKQKVMVFERWPKILIKTRIETMPILQLLNKLKNSRKKIKRKNRRTKSRISL